MALALLGPGLRQDSSRDFSVVEREYFGPDDLVRLVALARYDHRIKSLGPAQGCPNRGRPVGFGGVAVGRHPRSAHTGDDLVDNRLRALRARVVRGHPYAVAQASGDLAHDRPLAAVAVAPAAEDGAEARARELARRGQHALERVRGVGVVDHDEERLAGPHLLEPTRDRADRCERTRDRRRLEAYRQPGGEGA